ncbi:glycosyltransferase family 4 protein [Microlunatus soli]|uniref:Glycosyltransferase involved in cell wall bisynthesis n=1 Tax=Microlunatus soli TaxID=630515 RepID=A0A1H1SN63_9ACTN|nr:glycosyltransferase family 4 protein [Microlunatus soli]SDS49440.1 Glycosyltransferase involved in cell wall bisynthesis [Microlunatus soli]
MSILKGGARPATEPSTHRLSTADHGHKIIDTDQAPPHVLIIVQNLPVPLDRRVWLECQALINRGYRVSVICPKGPGDPSRQCIDGVNIYKYKPAPDAEGLLGFAREFSYSWVRTALLSLQVWNASPFDIIQACNPPDTYWLLARMWRHRGVKFVFDQHDLNPELFLSRFGDHDVGLSSAELTGLLWLERRTYRTADRVISTNQSYKAIALMRGRRRAGHVTVVRSGPDTQQMRPIYPEHPRPIDGIELAYLGIMGPQDGVDQAIRVIDVLVHQRGRTNIHATLMGFGDALNDLKALSTKLGLDDHITFTGRVDRDAIAEHLSAADIGLCPDLKTPLNDISTMNKTMEYMAYGLPSVSYDLVETQVSGADTVQYVPSGDVEAFATAVERLIDNPALRVELGRKARARVSSELDWRPQAEAYVSVFDELSGFSQPGPALSASDLGGRTDPQGRRYVDLDDHQEFESYLQHRRAAQ